MTNQNIKIICDTEVEYIQRNDTYLFDARALIKLIWKNQSYYYNKWLKMENTTLQEVGEKNKYCTLNDLYTFWQDNLPSDKSKAKTYNEFYTYAWDELDKFINPKEEIEMIPLIEFEEAKTNYINQIGELTELIENEKLKYEINLKDKDESYSKLKNKYDKLLERKKNKTTLKDTLLHPELPLYAQMTVTVVLTFFTWTVFSHYFDFGSFSDYPAFHGGITLFAAIAFEFGILIFTVRRDVKWLNLSLLFQFIILGIHSGFLKFNFSSVEDFMIKLVLTLTLPLINKAFASTLFKK